MNRLALLVLVALAAACGSPSPRNRTETVPPAAWPGKTGCRALVGHTGPDEHCEARRLAGGRAVWTRVTISCGGDSCDVHDYIVTAGRAPVRLEGSGGAVVVDPLARFAIHEVVDLRRDLAGNERLGDWEIYLVRTDLQTGAAARWADCMAPALSPGGRWIICRDRLGDVFRSPTAGGPWERIYQLDLPGDAKVDWVPYAWTRPDQVSFPSPGELEVATAVVRDGDFATHVDRQPWHEGASE